MRFPIFLCVLFQVIAVVPRTPQPLDVDRKTPPATRLKITPSFSLREPVAQDSSIELYLSRPLHDPEVRVAVLIGTTDVSTLFAQSGLLLRYNARLWPLPLGESALTVYVVSNDDLWEQIGIFSLLVAKEQIKNDEAKPQAQFVRPARFADGLIASTDREAALGMRPSLQPAEPQQTNKGKLKLNLIPSLNVGIKTQPAQSTFPSANTPSDRATFSDLTMQASLKGDLSYNVFKNQSSFDFAGSSFQQEALRFGTLGNDAPNVDLASYLIQIQTGPVKFQVGHFGYGSHRHLINSFSSRGVNVTVPFLNRFDFSAAAMNGTQLVGYDNFFGLDKRRHQMLSGTLGMELFPKRPGALRFELAVLSAYFQPVSGVNRGVITDVQRSRGISIRVLGSDKNSRLRFEGGFTRNLFASPSDTTLEQGLRVVPLPTLLRNAHYFEVSYDVLRNVAITKTKRANLAVTFREENVAPLFRSLGASAQADKIQYDVSTTGSVGEITGQFSYSNFHDNVRRIPSILRTINGLASFSVAAPAKVLLNRSNDSPWLPRLGFNFNRLRARGAAFPVNGGFEIQPDAIPDLIGTAKTFTADWQMKKFTWGYNLNHSFQNNQQVGRENADQRVMVQTGRVGVTVNSRLNFNVDLSSESATNRETGRIDRTYRVGPGVSWQISRNMGVTTNFSNTIAGDAANTSRNRNTDLDISWTYRFQAGREGPRKVAGQFFIRYANRYSHTLDRIFFSDNLNKNQTLTANLSFTFF